MKENEEQTIPLTEKAIKAYLDNAIRRWRKRRDDAMPSTGGETAATEMALCYIDAFQSVRTSLFGEVLPKD